MVSLKNKELFQQAIQLFPGGVNSPVRAFRAVKETPRFIARGEGAYLVDVEGKLYIDYVGSWGPLILGHAHPEVLAALERTAHHGLSYGAPSPLEIELGRRIIQRVPSVEKLRFVSSGTEATMSAVRLARAATSRDLILKFDGCYHGHADSLLVRAGSGVATFGLPDSPGVPAAFAALTLSVPFNDLDAVKKMFHAHAKKIAAVIVEPVPGNMGVVLPDGDFLPQLRDITANDGALLILDEVMTGFRLAYGGAQEIFGIDPDLTCFGKVIGGGLPVGAYGGKQRYLSMIAPEGPVYQAGTLSGNPLAMAAGIATLDLLSREAYQRLNARSAKLYEGLQVLIDEPRAQPRRTSDQHAAVQLNSFGSMFTIFFTEHRVRDYSTAKTSDVGRFARFFRCLLENGIYFPPAQFEAAFVSLSHGESEIERTLVAAEKALRAAE
ncbi:MAG: glutamate-1-semialdehyde 2,1-aminomutase [Acidobacteria bacterium]|nr:glutamate-1-semialdehyde 2,1-aminomutase [Acidobacteriota bacterium]